MDEIWKTIIYNGIIYDNYQVSNLGKILSLNYRNTGKPKMMEPIERKDGYLQACLSKNNKKDTYPWHRIVAEAFLPNPLNKPYINHKIEGDEGKKINIVIFNEDGTVDEEKSTIEWCTAEENHNYGTVNERISKALSKIVLQFTLDGKFVKEWESVQECGRNGFAISAVCRCCNGKIPHYKGFIWKYKDKNETTIRNSTKDKIKERQKRYREKNKDKIREYQRQYRQQKRQENNEISYKDK